MAKRQPIRKFEFPLTPGAPAGTSSAGAPSTGKVDDSDKVDGFHAYAYAVPHALLALNMDAKLPADITGDAVTLGGYTVTELLEPADLSATSTKDSGPPHSHLISASYSPGESMALLKTTTGGLLTLYQLILSDNFLVGTDWPPVLGVNVDAGRVAINASWGGSVGLHVQARGSNEHALRIRKAYEGSIGKLLQIQDANEDQWWYMDSAGTLFTDNFEPMHAGARFTREGKLHVQELVAVAAIFLSLIHRTISVDNASMFVAEGVTLHEAWEIPEGVTPPPPPIVGFSATPTSGATPLLVNFSDESTWSAENPAVKWEWDISGDGTVDTEDQNPVGLYTDNYAGMAVDITLTVTCEDGQSDTHTKAGYIVLDELPPPPPDERVTDGLQLLYDFAEGTGSTVNDVSGVGTAYNLTIEDVSKVSWITTDVGLVINDMTAIKNTGACSKLYSNCTATGALTIDMWLSASDPASSILRRVFSYAALLTAVNVEIQQRQSMWQARLRTSGTTNDGKPSIWTPEGYVLNQPQHIAYTRASDGTEKWYVNAVQVASGTRTGTLSGSWDSGYGLWLANTPEAGRGWVGTLYLVGAYSRALTAAEITQNYNAGYGEQPTNTAPQAEFTASATTIDAGDTVHFTDLSVPGSGNPIVAWLWTLDTDDILNDSTEQNPTWTYPAALAGTSWGIKLIVTAQDGQQSTMWKPDYMTMRDEEPPPPPPPPGEEPIAISLPFANRDKVWTPTRWVSPNGSDSNDGRTESRAWQTIGKANAAATAGMVIGIKAGTYNDPVKPAGDGTGANNAIVYVKMGAGTVKIRRSGGTVCDLGGKHYVLIDGITFYITQQTSDTWLDMVNARYCCIRGCRFYADQTPKDIYSGSAKTRAASLQGAKYCHLDGTTMSNYLKGPSFGGSGEYNYISFCRFLDAGQHLSTFNNGTGNLRNYRHLFYRCYFDYAHKADCCQMVGYRDQNLFSGVIFKQCVFGRGGENNLDLKSSFKIVIDECIHFGSIGSSMGWHTGWDEGCGPTITVGNQGGALTPTDGNLVRRSVFFDTTQPLVLFPGWRFAHNTAIGCNRTYRGDDQTIVKSGSVIGTCGFRQKVAEGDQCLINTIVVGQNHVEGGIRDTGNSTVRIDYNNWWDDKGYKFAAVTGSTWADKTYEQWTTLLGNRGVQGAEAHSMRRDPKFRDCPIRPNYQDRSFRELDFRIQESSPCRNTGGPVARTTSAGSGQWVNVSDPYLFCDGFGIAKGDLVGIDGTGDTWHRIIEIDYSGKRIKLEEGAGVSWGKNAGIHYPYTGGAPDIGALSPDSENWWQDIS